MRLWGGRFSEANDARVAEFTRSVEIDRELAADDISGSIAHVRGLGRAGLLTGEQVDALVAGLRRSPRTSPRTASTGTRPSRTSTSTSSPRSAERIGPVAGKLHTGRSRNDQVATDLRLWTRRADRPPRCRDRRVRARAGRSWPSATARRSCPARPISSRPSPCCSRHHLLAYVEMAERDRGRLADARRRLNVSPLGAGRAGRRGLPARPRGDGRASSASTASPRTRSMPSATATSWSRSLAAVALGMVHLVALAEEITWWSNPRFGFVRVVRCVLDRLAR